MSEHIAWRDALEEARQEATQNGKLVLSKRATRRGR